MKSRMFIRLFRAVRKIERMAPPVGLPFDSAPMASLRVNFSSLPTRRHFSLRSKWLPKSVTIKNVLLDVSYCEILQAQLQAVFLFKSFKSCSQFVL